LTSKPSFAFPEGRQNGASRRKRSSTSATHILNVDHRRDTVLGSRIFLGKSISCRRLSSSQYGTDFINAFSLSDVRLDNLSEIENAEKADSREESPSGTPERTRSLNVSTQMRAPTIEEMEKDAGQLANENNSQDNTGFNATCGMPLSPNADYTNPCLELSQPGSLESVDSVVLKVNTVSVEEQEESKPTFIQPLTEQPST
ncbi:hypothetical protein M513_14134, partial [Trichuris suis]